MISSDQCALGSDGNLRDAEHITWYNDADDMAPLPTPAEPHTQKLHAFFSGAPAPAFMVAGSRCSARVSHPNVWLIQTMQRGHVRGV
ncbi:hypothetical protein BYT27DRAFT_7081585 [Phlegmacium glaucopus]|nr:hypothetical protein BYT27DRAFT_7081585 [Phlegmacium glaucopus]